MGWTSYHLDDLSRESIKGECDSIWNGEILKSTMVGNTYYGALKTNDGRVVGVVVQTGIDNRNYYNFFRKEMDEFCGPNYSQCPGSILKLLSPTNHEWACAWRNRCHEYNERKKALRKYTFGTTICVNGVEYIKFRYRNGHRWVNMSRREYIPETRIAEYGFSEA